MQVLTFDVVNSNTTRVPPDVSIEQVYDHVEANTAYLVAILEAEKNAVKTLLKGEDPWSSPLLSFILQKNNLSLSSTEEEIQEVLKDRFTSLTAEKYRFALALQSTLLDDSLYENVKCHMLVDGHRYAGHFLTYSHRENVVGARDLYMSLAVRKEALSPRTLDVVVNHLVQFAQNNGIVVESQDPLLRKILMYIEAGLDGNCDGCCPEGCDEDHEHH